MLTERAPRWVAWWFRGAAVYGTAALLVSLLRPASTPPALMAQLAFVGTALAFQIVFWIIGGDPVRHRPLMLAAVAEKLAFGVPGLALAGSPGIAAAILPLAVIDLVLGVGFLIAWSVTADRIGKG